ncbi:RNA methyltransferase [Hansschlegelia beijingensis]|uniref:tRNA/rRNA methyltransferase n=1 Tax=Hansschlegelia beijingensis TaxID=1133344 RepID=A0A7W6D2V0_9HYPH|nr:RNA methyltransferase [Hansschlegelia beijingensis]MBB3973556.1 tRNA/rRNA methyltransferase [Hansschlegelia beijingensis]
MAGTDRTKADAAALLPAGPAVVLVEPQLAENVGAVARAMANFALSDLRVVRAPGKTEAEGARVRSAGAHHILEAARHFDSIEEAIADLTLLFATTARGRGQAKPVDAPEAAARLMAQHAAGGGRVGLLFGRERTGLENDEIALASRVVTFPVNPAYASLNLAQAVLLVGYEWFKAATGGAPAFEMPTRSPPGTQAEIVALFAHLEGELDETGFFRSPEKRASMIRNIRNMIHRMDPSRQDLQTLHGIVAALAEGRPGPQGRGRTLLKPLKDPEEG